MRTWVPLLLAACAATPRGEEIVAGGRPVPAGTRVVLWSDARGLDGYAGGGGRHGARTSADLQAHVRQVVLHYDAAGTSAQCHAVLVRRGLSCHFLVDLDGTVYQTLDLSERAWHAGPANDISVGIEIANPGAYADPAALEPWTGRLPEGVRRGALPEGFAPRPARPGPLRGRIHGVELHQHDYTDAQYEALGRLCAALCRAFPRVRPEAPASRTVLDDPAAFEGLVGHYHWTRGKVDPGPAFDWDRFLALVRKELR